MIWIFRRSPRLRWGERYYYSLSSVNRKRRENAYNTNAVSLLEIRNINLTQQATNYQDAPLIL